MKHIPRGLIFAILISFHAITGASESVGTITKIMGSAIEAPPGLTMNQLSLNSPVHENSEIKTGKGARVKIVFNDQSTIILGEWAHIKLDQFMYQPESSLVAQTQFLDILGGTFRYKSGSIGKKNQQQVRITTPVATIGIRGTDFFGGPLAAGMPRGQIHYGFMVIDGAIDVTNPYGSVLLDEKEEGTFLPMAGNKAPTVPSTWDQEATREAYDSISFQ